MALDEALLNEQYAALKETPEASAILAELGVTSSGDFKLLEPADVERLAACLKPIPAKKFKVQPCLL